MHFVMNRSPNKTGLSEDNMIDSQDLEVPNSFTQETVKSVFHWTDRMFSFRISRPATFRFRSGEFVMLGLFCDGVPLLRAYSISSPAWDDELEFFSIKVQGGPLTSRPRTSLLPLQVLHGGDAKIAANSPASILVSSNCH